MWGLLGKTSRTLFRLASDEDTFGGEWDFPNEELPCFPLPVPPPIEWGELLPPDKEDGEHGLWYPLVEPLLTMSNMVPEEDGRGEQADWGDSWFGCKRLELSWGNGDTELSGRFTGTGDIPDDEAYRWRFLMLFKSFSNRIQEKKFIPKKLKFQSNIITHPSCTIHVSCIPLHHQIKFLINFVVLRFGSRSQCILRIIRFGWIATITSTPTLTILLGKGLRWIQPLWVFRLHWIFSVRYG